jgi:hypothetical protein
MHRALAVAVLLGVSSCGGDDDEPSSEPPRPTAAATARLEPSAASVAASRRAVRAAATPRSAGERTTFRVHFTGRARLGRAQGRRRGYEVALRANRNTGACLVNPSGLTTRGRRGGVVTVRFDPGKFKGGRWCRSTHRGRVFYYDTYACPARGRCQSPAGFERLRRLVGRFSLRVR